MFAHGGDSILPASDWLLAYLAIALVLVATVAARATLPASRGAAQAPLARGETDPLGGLLGVGLLGLVVAIAVAGPDTAGGNLAPVTVLSLWWVGMPLVAVVVGDVMRVIGPFDEIARLLRLPRDNGRIAPPWAAPLAMALVGWYALAYHATTSPRSLAIALVAYTALVVAGAAAWGRRWLQDEEPFAVLSRAFSGLLRGRRPPASTAVTAVTCLWAATALFEALLATRLWVDVQGTRRGWSLTLVDSAGLLWAGALVAAVHIVATRLVERVGSIDRATAVRALVAVPVLVSLGWVVAHEGPGLVISAQNALVLASDPFGQGADLLGTIDRPVDYSILSPEDEGRLQLGVLALTHVGAVVLAVRTLRDAAGAAAHRLAWIAGAEIAIALVTAVLVLIGGGHE